MGCGLDASLLQGPVCCGSVRQEISPIMSSSLRYVQGRNIHVAKSCSIRIRGGSDKLGFSLYEWASTTWSSLFSHSGVDAHIRRPDRCILLSPSMLSSFFVLDDTSTPVGPYRGLCTSLNCRSFFATIGARAIDPGCSGNARGPRLFLFLNHTHLPIGHPCDALLPVGLHPYSLS
jgi:hypothetical protein